jgi:hypothetical protein
MERFLPPRPSAGYGFRKATSAGAKGTEENAPKVVTIDLQYSTLRALMFSRHPTQPCVPCSFIAF